MNLDQRRLQYTQDEYLDLLENNYQGEQLEKQVNDLRIHSMCARIQRFYRKRKENIKIRAAVLITAWWQKLMNKRNVAKQVVQKVKEIISARRIFYFLKLAVKKRIIDFHFIQDKKSIIKATYYKNELFLIRFIQIYIAFRYRKRKGYLKYILRKSNTKRQLELWKIKQQQISQRLLYFDREQTMTNEAFNAEIQFVDNTLAFNRLIFTQKWEEYEKKLTRFMRGRVNHHGDYVEQRTDAGEIFWTNLKTLEQTQINPVETFLAANIKVFKEDANKDFEEKNRYLEEARLKLCEQKRQYQNVTKRRFQQIFCQSDNNKQK